MSRDELVRAATIAVAWVVVLVVLMLVPPAVFDGENARGASLLVGYIGLAISLVLLYVVSRATFRGNRWLPAALCTAAVMLTGALALPLAYLVPEVRGNRVEIVPTNPLDPDFYEAMLWIRDEVPFDEAIAINSSNALQFHPSAFSEHRVFIEGWQYSQESVDAGFEDVAAARVNPFADRVAINEAAFTDADPDSLATMYEDYGVRYLVIDEEGGFPADVEGLMEFGRTVYEGPGIQVLQLTDPR